MYYVICVCLPLYIYIYMYVHVYVTSCIHKYPHLHNGFTYIVCIIHSLSMGNKVYVHPCRLAIYLIE